MRRICQVYTYFILTFFIVLAGCGKDNDGDGVIDDYLVGVTLEVDFSARIDGSDGTVETGPDTPVLAVEGDKVTFINRSLQTNLFFIADNEEVPYTGELTWEFEGGDPSSSSSDQVEVTYNTPGKYYVKLKLIDEGGNEETFFNYVCVLAKPIEMCFPESEVFSDGRSAEYLYDDSHQLGRVNYSFNDNLAEYHLFKYDNENRLETQEFYNSINELLGTRGLIYDDSGRIENDKTVDASNNLVIEISYTWAPEGYVTNAVYKQPDGVGGIATVNGTFTWDQDFHNIGSIQYADSSGNGLGYDEIEYNDGEKPYADLPPIEPAPFYLNRYDFKSKKRYDAANNLVDEISRVLDESYGSEFCNRAKIITETINEQNPVTITRTYYQY